MIKIKHIASLLAASLLISACSPKKAEEPVAPAAVPVAEVKLPYNLTIKQFSIGSAELAKSILQGSWKDYEDNTLNNSWLSDSLSAYSSDGTFTKGSAALLARWNKNRAELANTKVTVNAVLPVHDSEKNEDWVLVWADEIDTKKDGTADTVALMETWLMGKDGKATLLFQYDRKKRKK